MPMLDQIAGNEQTVAAIKTALAGQCLPHAVLLAAPDGCGRNFAARCLAADYLFPPGDALGGDAGARAVLRGESPEVLLVQGEGRSGQIPVDRIRAVRADVFYSALSAAGRVVLVRDAHNMAAPAANALLKVLEEPPADVLFVLTTHSPGALPATIYSRCAAYSLGPAGPAACRDMLQLALRESERALAPVLTKTGVQAQALPELLAALYGGRVGLGLQALARPERLQIALDALEAVRAASLCNTYALLCVFARYEGRGDEDRAGRDALLADMTAALEAALLEQTMPGLPQMPPQAASLLLAPLAETRNALRGNAAPKITFTALAVQAARVGRPARA